MIPLDKQLHFLAGLAIMLSIALFTNWQTGFVAALVAGAGKEIVDYFGHGTPDHWDAIVTGVGGIVGAALYNLQFILE